MLASILRDFDIYAAAPMLSPSNLYRDGWLMRSLQRTESECSGNDYHRMDSLNSHCK